VKRSLGRPRRRFQDNINMDLREIWWEGLDWDSFGSGYGPIGGFSERGTEPSGFIKGGQFLIS